MRLSCSPDPVSVSVFLCPGLELLITSYLPASHDPPTAARQSCWWVQRSTFCYKTHIYTISVKRLSAEMLFFIATKYYASSKTVLDSLASRKSGFVCECIKTTLAFKSHLNMLKYATWCILWKLQGQKLIVTHNVFIKSPHFYFEGKVATSGWCTNFTHMSGLSPIRRSLMKIRTIHISLLIAKLTTQLLLFIFN